MEPGQAEQLASILGSVSVGVATLDSTTLCIQYVNSYLSSLLGEPWHNQHLRGQNISDIIPRKLHPAILPLLHQVAATGQRFEHPAVPYEGFLEARGRTYWRVTVECIPTAAPHTTHEAASYKSSLLITITDVTDAVRSRLHLHAIHYISSAIAGPSSLHLVLDRILQVIQEMVGSKRCTILLIDHALPATETRNSSPLETALTLTVAAQKGIHPRSQDWHPSLDEHILLGHVMREHHTMIITDTRTTPEIEFPFVDNKGAPCRPGSALCVPIFEPRNEQNSALALNGQTGKLPAPGDTVLGSIEVYHRHARGFPAEEVRLLERFAQQAGLAIQHARLFRSIDRWARAASRHARQKENIMQAIPDGVVIYDPRWRVADLNYAARQLLGWSDDIIGLPITEALHRSSATFQEDLTSIPNLVEELEQRALSGQIDEFKMRSAQGQACTMRCSYTPIRDELGDVFAFIVIYHDVTQEVADRERIEAEVVARTAELKQRNTALQIAQAEQALTNARMSLLLERLPSGVILVSAANSAISVINRQAVQILQSCGAPLEPLDDPDEACRRAIGMDCEQLLGSIHPTTPSGTALSYEERPLHRALVTGEAAEAELQVNRTDGQIMHLLVNTASLRAPDGTITSAILVLQEITRIKALERAREDFFTTMAHELKTPLANIRAHLSALLARDLQWSSEEQYDFIQTADEQVERLVRMINYFLDASRVEAGALRLELEPILLAELFEDLEDRLEALITASHRSLKISLPAHLPAVLGDYELLISVLTNLLSNAFRYAPEGDAVLLRAEPLFNPPDPAQPSSRPEPIAVRLSVIDRGPGISPEQQAALFTRFSTFAAMSRPSINRPGQPTLERQQKTSRWSPATGLGLYISRGIIEAHGSKLSLSSSPGQGATFAFTLPVFHKRSRRNSKQIMKKETNILTTGECGDDDN